MEASEAAYEIRRARSEDVPAVQHIEQQAALRFHAIGMRAVAEAPRMDAAMIGRFLAEGALFVVEHARSEPVGFVACCVLDGAGHVAELDVLATHAGRRLGARLVARAVGWAQGLSLPRLTLVTFRDVPWNAPYYRRLGFRDLPYEALGPAHRAVWAGQAEMGLDMSARLAMERAV